MDLCQIRYLFSREAQAVQNGQNPLQQISQGFDYLGDHIELGYDDLLGINPNLTEQNLNYMAFNVDPNGATPTPSSQDGNTQFPALKCENCGKVIPGGGAYYPYCYFCYLKSKDPNGQVPPIPAPLDPQKD